MELSSLRPERIVEIDLGGTRQGGILLMPLGDLHLGCQDAHVKRLQEYVRWGLDHGAYFLGMGDYIDFASPSNQKALGSAQTHDNTEDRLDNWMRALVEEVAEILAPTKGRWAGMIRGHHFWTYGDGKPSDAHLAELLGAPYFGTCGLVGFRFDEGVAGVWFHHGAGAAQTWGGLFNRIERASLGFDADVYCVGHLHRIGAVRSAQVVTNWEDDKMEHRSPVLVATGSFMSAYTQGRTRRGYPEGSYAEQKMLLPSALGSVLIHIIPAIEGGLFLPVVHVTI